MTNRYSVFSEKKSCFRVEEYCTVFYSVPSAFFLIQPQKTLVCDIINKNLFEVSKYLER